MPSIISTGIGSGLDVSGLVQQLVAAEAAPVETRLGTQEARTQAKLSGFGSLKSALSDFRDKLDAMKDINNFLARSATSSNEDLFTVTVDESALPANYSIEVVQLAQAQKLTSAAIATPDTAVGTGTLRLSLGAAAFNVEISSENNTLTGIRDAINNASTNSGIAATIVNAADGSYLILSGEKTGVVHDITVTQSGGDGGLNVLEYDPANGLNALTETAAAQDSLLRIDGLEVASAGNLVEGAIDGVSIDLLQADPGFSDSLLIANDNDAVKQTIAEFVESYNVLVDTFDQLTSFNAEAETAAPLLGDSTIRGIRDQVRRVFSTAVQDIDAPFQSLAEIGVETQLDGKLEIDDAKLNTILTSDFSKLGQLFANADGYATRMHSLVDGYLQTGGIIQTRTDGLTSRIDDFSEQRDALGRRLASLEVRLTRQFNALDTLVGELSSTSNFLSQQLNSLPGFGSVTRN